MNAPALPACEVCGGPGHGIASLPGIPMSCCRCGNCWAAGAVPYYVLVANTADIGGESDAAPWWTEVIEATLRVLGVRHDEFTADVAAAIERDMCPDPEPLPDPEGPPR